MREEEEEEELRESGGRERERARERGEGGEKGMRGEGVKRERMYTGRLCLGMGR
jgi:hypothetical protein